MADLQPLGSEKLQGMEKIQRILEIARFRENQPSVVNETSRNEYNITLVDGNEYQIVKEKSGYIIKKTISESETDYIEPMKNRKYYPSYSQALKRLNLMIKENNSLNNNKEGISLFSEQKKFTLKTPEKKTPDVGDEIENVPPPPPSPAGEETPPPPPMGDEGSEEMPPAPPMGDEGSEEMPPAPPMGDEGQSDDEDVTFKSIQKLVGKVSQKIRTLEEKQELSSSDAKYIINSILSAVDLSKLESDDLDEIMSKFEDVGEESDMSGMEDEEGSDDEEATPPPPMGDEGEEPSSEMGESWDTLGTDIATKTLSKMITPGQFKEEEDEDAGHIGMIADELFVESKIEDILTKYFVISEDEKKFNKVIESNRKTTNKIKTKNVSEEIKRLSESVKQEITSKKFIREKTNVKFVGKTNKKNLVFESNNKQYKITPEGNILWII